MARVKSGDFWRIKLSVSSFKLQKKNPHKQTGEHIKAAILCLNLLKPAKLQNKNRLLLEAC